MAKDLEYIKEILTEALEKESETERKAYLDEVCRNDVNLRTEIESLLRSHDNAGDFLEESPFGPDIILDESPISEGPGSVIGRYKLLEKIGEGGMAVVYMAEQETPIRRKVALKIIKLGMDTKSIIARFEAERQALAMMDHPNIAKVLDAGATETGRPYFVMELVTGVSITEYCDKNNLSTKDRLALFIQVCNAVQHAHQKGIIHRDIKPTNVMVTLRDGQPMPKVIDFGIAKAINQKLTEKTLFTRYAHIIGTPAYMSPEQAELSDLDVDTRTDIYSLGVLLYELLTGTTPFSEEELRKAGYTEMQRVIREQEPVKPSTRIKTAQVARASCPCSDHMGGTPMLREVRGDLDWIVMKSLEKDRTRRYGTVNGLAVDIERHLNSEPVQARPPSTIYRFRKLVRRNKGVFAGAAAVATALVMGLTVSVVSLLAEHRARQLAVAAGEVAVAAQVREAGLRQEAVAAQEREAILRQEAEARELYARRLAYASDMSLAQQALAVNDLGRALRLLEAHRPVPGEVDLRDWEWRYLWHECRSDALAKLCRYPNRASRVAFSPDGKLLGTTQAFGEFVEIWDVPSRKQIAALQGEAATWANRIAFSPQGDLVATISGKQILLWRIGTWNRVGRLALDGSVHDLKFSPDGSRLACMSYSNEVLVWEADQWTIVNRIGGVRPAGANLGAFDFSSDGRVLLIGDFNHRLQAIDLASGNTLFDIADAHPEPISSVAWSPDGSIIASGSAYTLGAIHLWDAVSGTLLDTLEGHTAWVCRLIFSSDSAWLYSSSADQTIRIWDVGQRRCLSILRGSRDEVNGLALSPDGATLASACKDGTVAFWNAHPRPDQEQPQLITMGRQAQFAFAPDSRVVAVPREGIVRLFDLTTLQEIEQLPALGDKVGRVAYSPDGTLLVSGGWDGKICVWSCAERRLLKELDASDAGILLCAFRAYGRRMLSIDAQGQVIWWDTVVWQPVQRFVLDRTGLTLRTAAVSPDGRLLAAGSGLGAVGWVNAETGELLDVTSGGHRDRVYGFAFSGDGARAVSVGTDGMVAIWDTASLQLIDTFKGHMGGALGVAFSPDSRRFATGGGTHEAVKFWDVESHREVMTLPSKDSLFWAVAFSPDGRWLAACSEISGQLHLWRGPSWEEIEAAENVYEDPVQRGMGFQPMDHRQDADATKPRRQGSVIFVVDFDDNGMVQGREE